MNTAHLLFPQADFFLSLPADRIQRIQEAGSVVPFPGAGGAVRGLSVCGGRSRIVLNLPGLLPPGAAGSDMILADGPPLWVLLEGEADGLVLEIQAPLSFSTPVAKAPRPTGTMVICDRGERHSAGVAGLISTRRLLVSFRRTAGSLTAIPPSGGTR
ncbi:MAG: hypothetical protein E2P03_01145 [Acidobacteria bacterium]|nr:MAG: hypothetical protein E2P03_01145 [Acidobacteriota bacterium]